MSTVNESALREFLTANLWPPGLQDALIKGISRYPARYFICDDSGSMIASDGNRLVGSATHYKMVPCTRWAELTDSLKFHVQLAQSAGAISEFRLLNNLPPVTIGTGDRNAYTLLLDAFDRSPSGGTPLCRHISEIVQQIRSFESQLRANSQKACVIICTDGESSDGDIAEAMKPLCTLPVWVVVRLCTDEERIVQYWENIDKSLELDMDVLDDLHGEAEQVFVLNSWLTFGQPLHHLREFGFNIKEFDLLDEQKLNLEQVRVICSIILGGRVDDYPHPEVDFKGFITEVNKRNKALPKVYDPITKQMHHWIKVDKLKSIYGKGCQIM
eukprot:gene21816-28234_t